MCSLTIAGHSFNSTINNFAKELAYLCFILQRIFNRYVSIFQTVGKYRLRILNKYNRSYSM